MTENDSPGFKSPSSPEPSLQRIQDRRVCICLGDFGATFFIVLSTMPIENVPVEVSVPKSLSRPKRRGSA